MATETILVTAFSGGLAGALLTLLVQSFCRWWNRPILKIVFHNDEPGCRVSTPGWIIDEQGEPLKDPQGNVRTVQQYYLRLKIENRGNTFAKNVSVCITEIIFRAPGSGEKKFAEEVFDLKLALTRDTAAFNLSAKGHRFVDLVHTQDCGQGVQLAFDLVKAAARLGLQGFSQGTYEMKVFTSAENANSTLGNFVWSCGGTLDSIKIEAV